MNNHVLQQLAEAEPVSEKPNHISLAMYSRIICLSSRGLARTEISAHLMMIAAGDDHGADVIRASFRHP